MVLQGGAQIIFQPHSFQSSAIHFFGEEAIALTRFLGRVHRHIGILHQGLHVLSIDRKDADPNTNSHIEVMVVEMTWACNGRTNFLGHFRDISVSRQVIQNNSKLIAAQSRHIVILPYTLPKALGDHFKQNVSSIVPERIIDVFKLVQI